MALTNAGRNLIATMIVGGAYTAFNAANAYLGSGNSNTAFAGAQSVRSGSEAMKPTANDGILDDVDVV